MAQTCSKCSRVNPAEALYCYFDGSVLGDRPRARGPINTGTQLFHNLFTFPSGWACRNFDQLAVACQERWSETLDLLAKGYLEGFLSGLGRPDLAQAAREAAGFPDLERGLDQLLAKLPSQVLDPPKLQVEPSEVSLGLLKVGEDRNLELHLTNLGQRLLYGSVTCDNCLWLTLGEAPGTQQKLFQFGTELVIPLHVLGKRLRASSRPQEGRLVVESNGGNCTVLVRCEVPARPFTEGALAGARSPRELAGKARTAPKEAAPHFENGAVARWYKENGWQFPVQGPSAGGLAAVQQFFEALGLTPPPKVELSEKSVSLSGAPGETLRYTLEVRTQEKRPVYAYGVSNQPWVEVGRAQLNGRVATVPLAIPSVPDRPGEKLEARVKIKANGNQRFVIPVWLEVSYNLNFDDLAATQVPGETLAPPEPEPVKPAAAEKPAKPARRFPKLPALPSRRLLHALPAVLLLLAVLGVAAYDVFVPPGEVGGSGGLLNLSEVELLSPDPVIGVQFSKGEPRFGIVTLNERERENEDKFKRLTYAEDGGTNNTCVKIDNHEYLFGVPPGAIVPRGRLHTYDPKLRLWRTVCEYPEKVVVTQTVQIVPGEQTRLLDTCLVRYTIENKSDLPRTVGLRVMLDTYIGANDGVPFQVPGESALLETQRKIEGKSLPDFIQALERPDPKEPGTVANMGLKLSGLEPLESLLISRYPDNPDVRWDWKPAAMNEPADAKRDSCVTLYWAYKQMEPGTRRTLGFTYGLGKVSGASGQLAVSTHGSTKPGGTFTVTAVVKQPEVGQKVKIQLPAGLKLVGGDEEQTIDKVEPGKDAQVSWRVQAAKVGDYAIEVTSRGYLELYRVRINNRSIFD